MKTVLLCTIFFLCSTVLMNAGISFANQPANSFELGLYPLGADASYERLIVDGVALFLRGNYILTVEMGGPPEATGAIVFESGELGSTFYLNQPFNGFYIQTGLGWASGEFPGSGGVEFNSLSITVMPGWKTNINSWLFSRFGFGIDIQPEGALVPLLNAGLGVNF